MKALFCHNHYQQQGGEDHSFADEVWLLQSHGHEVVKFELHNDAIFGMNHWNLARRTIWNSECFTTLRQLIHHERPDIMHCTNIFPLISPAAYYAARNSAIPVVQSLHNYRMFCPNAYFYRSGSVCEDCLGKAVPWPGIMHGCYRNSRAASSVVALMLSAHRALRTWSRTVTTYVTPTEFSRRKLIEGGLSPARVFVKPNFVRVDPGCGSGDGGYAVFAGRLSVEKGIQTLLDAWVKLAAELPLKIVGDGPLSAQVRAAAAGNTRIEWLGWRPMAEVLSIIGDAAFLIMPSNWYETFGRTIIEAFAKGTPVVASNLGAMAELVADRHTGQLFESADSQDLARKVRSLLSDPPLLAKLRKGARREYESRYTSEHNYRMLMDIYEHAIALHRHSLQLKSTG